MTLCYYCMGKLSDCPTYHTDRYLKCLVKICDRCNIRLKNRTERRDIEGFDVTDTELDPDFDTLEDK